MLAAGAGSVAAGPLESLETIVAEPNANTASGVNPLAGRSGGLVPEGTVFSSAILTADFDDV